MKKKIRNTLGFDFAKWSSALLMIAFFRPKIHYPFGRPQKNGKMIVSSNHIGPLDCVKIAFVFPWRRIWTLTRGECFRTKFSSWIFRAILCIPVDRENLSMSTHHEIQDLLKDDKLILFFSEGRINFSGDGLLDYKMGTAFFAAMSGTPVIPVYLSLRKNFWRRTQIVVGKELHLKDVCDGSLSMQNIEKFHEYIRKNECELEKWKNEHLGE